MKSICRPALTLFVALSLICSVLYPLAMTIFGRLVFPDEATGSLAQRNGQTVGSRLIGQSFTASGDFWGRPSATTPMPYNGILSGGSNMGPTNPAQLAAVKSRVDALKAADPANVQPVPVDMATASASGLDPDISVAAAYYQAARVARERGLRLEEVRALIDQSRESPYFGFLGEPRVNVLMLNLALDQLRRQ